MIWKDKLGRTIKVGDIVVRAASYECGLYIGKIRKLSNNSVMISYFGVKNQYGWQDPTKIINMEIILKSEPNSWSSWTKDPEHKLLILKRPK